MASIIQFNKELEDQIVDMKRRGNTRDTEKSHDTVFSALLEFSLPPEQLSVTRLQHEAVSVTAAGIETTMRDLFLACYHILANPPVFQRLPEELITAIPDPENPPSWDELGILPYLSACIEERKNRLPPPRTFVQKEEKRRTKYYPFQLSASPTAPPNASLAHSPTSPSPTNTGPPPPGAAISMDNYAVSHDPTIFPDHKTYNPSRWLHDRKAPSSKQLSRYMVAFGRGTRSCVGMHLAYAELYIGLSTLFRRFDMKLFETDWLAVDLFMDKFVLRPRPGTKGVRGLFKGLV